MKRLLKKGLALLLAAVLMFGGVPFASFAVATPTIQNLKGEATGVSTGNFSWELNVNAPYIFDGYVAELDGSSKLVPSNTTSLNLSGLEPGTKYQLDLKASYHKISEYTFEIERITTVDKVIVEKEIISTPQNINSIWSKVETGGSYQTNPRLFYVNKNDNVSYTTYEAAVRAKFSNLVITFVTPFIEHDHSGWREEIIPKIIYNETQDVIVNSYKYNGVTYSKLEDAINKVIEDFDEKLFDSYDVVPPGDFNVNNIMQIKILGRNNYETEFYSANFTTKAWSTVTVKFHSDYNQPSDIVKTYNETVVNTPTPAEVDGYRFMGWFNEPTFDSAFNNTVSHTEPYDVHTSKDVYAKWYKLPLSTFTVNFIVDGNEVDSDTVTFEDKAIDVPADPKKEGFEFLGWKMPNGDVVTNFNELVTYDEQYEGEYVLNLVAKWRTKGISTFDLFFKVGDTTYEVLSFEYNDSDVELPDNPVKEGYKFIEWQLDNEAADFSSIVKYPSPYDGEYNATVYAKFEKLSTFTVNFYNVDEKLLKSEILVHPDGSEELIIPDAPSIKGYAFVGWFEEDSEEEVDFDEAIVYEKDTLNDYVLNVYAKYRALPLSTFIINFNANGGSPVTSIVLEHPDTVFQVPSTTRNGYTFSGWFYESEEGEVEFNSNYEVEYFKEYEGEQTLDVYAKWTAIPPQPPTPPTPPTPTPPTPTPTEPTEDIDDEPVAQGAAIEQVDVDQFLVEPTFEEVVEVDVEDIPLGPSTLPQTGQLPAELFYGIGGLITAAGAFMKRKK